MRPLEKYGLQKEGEEDQLPWLPTPRPPFQIWVKPEEIAPFFLIPHHPDTISLLLKISDGFRAEVFRACGLAGSSGDWETLAKRLIEAFEEEQSGAELFGFDSDEDIFCVFSRYIDDLMMFARMLRNVCENEKQMIGYLTGKEPEK